MSDPKRLRESASDAFVLGILASADRDVPSQGSQDRALRSALGAVAGTSVLLATNSATAGIAKGAAAKGILATSVMKWGLAFAVGASTAVVVVEAREASRAPAVIPAIRPLATAAPGLRVARAASSLARTPSHDVALAPSHGVPSESPAVVTETAVSRAPRATEVAQVRAPIEAAPPPPPRLAVQEPVLRVEAETVRGIRASITRDPDLALAAVEVYRRRHAGAEGRLGEEVDALEVEALAARRDHELARQAAHRFAGLHPASVHLARIRALTPPPAEAPSVRR
jgi:hypothetical protein